MLKNVFKRNIVAFLMLPVFSVIFSVVITQTVLAGYKELLQEAAEGFTRYITGDLTLTLGIFLYGAGTVSMLIFAASLFREIFSKRSATFYFSMPVKRGVYFNTNMIFGITSLLLSYVALICIPIAIVKGNAAYQAGIILLDIPVFMNCLTITALCVAVSYAIFLLCAVLSGRVWQYFVLCLIAAQAGNAVANFRSYLNTVWGFHIESSLSWLISPSAIYSKIFGELVTDPLKYIIALIVQFAVVYAAGYIVFKHRKAEVAEVSLTGRIVPSIMITISLFSVGFAVLSADMRVSVYVKLLIALIAVLLAAMLLTAIFYKKAFTKNTLGCFIATVIIAVVTFAAVELIPNTNFKNYVPTADEVESVTLDESVDFGNEGTFSSKLLSVMLGFSDESLFYNEQIGMSYTFTSEETKEKIEAFHNKLIAQSTIDNAYGEDYYYHGYYSVKLVYHLKNGKTVTRSYCVGTKDVYKEYIAVMKTEEAIRLTVSDYFEDKEVVYIGLDEYVSNEDWYNDNYDPEFFPFTRPTVYATLDEYDTLLDMIIKDRLNEPETVFADLGLGWAFQIYDPNGYYRDEGYWDMAFGVADDETDYQDYEDYKDISIRFNVWSDEATDEQKALLRTMTAEQMAEYEKKLFNEGYDNYPFASFTLTLNREADTNTMEYLRSQGLID